MTAYAEAMDAVEKLNVEEQEELLATMRRRIIERRRAALLSKVREARAEARGGKAKAATPTEIMRMLRE